MDFELSTGQLVTLLGSNGFTSRVERASFAPAVAQLKVAANLGSYQLIAVLKKDQVAARVESQNFATAFAQLPLPRTRKCVRDLCVRIPRCN